jgi:hypothetical protein
LILFLFNLFFFGSIQVLCMVLPKSMKVKRSNKKKQWFFWVSFVISINSCDPISPQRMFFFL